MGALRPRWRHGNHRDLFLFVGGFMAASVLFLSALYAIGADARGVSDKQRRFAVASAVVVLLLNEIWRISRGRLYALGWERQSPQTWRRSRYGALGWGLDAGLPFTTFRTTPLTWVAILLLIGGFGSWWSVPAYGLGFCLPLIVQCIWPGRGDDETFRGPATHGAWLRPVRVAMIPITAIVSTLALGTSPAHATETTAGSIGCFSFDARTSVVPENFKSVTPHFAVVGNSPSWNTTGRVKFPIALRTDSRIEITIRNTDGSPSLVYGSPHDKPVKKLTFGPCSIIVRKRPWGIKIGSLYVQRPSCVKLFVRSTFGGKTYNEGTISLSVGTRCPAKQRR